MMHLSQILRRFEVRGVLWRHYLDFALANVPFYLQPSLLFVWTIFFYFFAAPARRSLVRNLSVVLPGSSRPVIYLRAFRTLLNFAWTITDGAAYKINKAEFAYEIVGAELLQQLSVAKGAIVITAHMGNYDLGAALFAGKFAREISMVRAPEPDLQTAHHLSASVEQAGSGAVKIAYSNEGTLVAFDLLDALRRGEIVSIQGDRVTPGVAAADGRMFGETVRVPSGPFTLAQVARVPIFPLFIVRDGYRRYRIIVRDPISVARTTRARADDLATAIATWCDVLEETIRQHWDQWFALAPIFALHDNQ